MRHEDSCTGQQQKQTKIIQLQNTATLNFKNRTNINIDVY